MDTANLDKHGWTHEKLPGNRLAAFDPDGVQRCGAMTSSTETGTPCKRYPVEGRERCRFHGGTQKRGADHHQYKDGRYSRHLPRRLATRAEQLMGDPELLSLRENLVLLDVRLSDLTERLDPGDYGDKYAALHDRYQAARELLTRGMNGDRAALRKFVSEFESMGEMIAAGQAEFETWQNIITLNDRRRVMTKTIQDIRYKKQNAVAVDRLALVLSRIASAFERVNEYDNPEQRAQVFDREIVSIMQIEDTSA